jgi:hypothetical protein
MPNLLAGFRIVAARSPLFASTEGWALPALCRDGLKSITLIILWAVLVSPRYRTGRVALSISDIEINAVTTAGDWVPSATISSTTIVLSGCLVLRRKRAVRIAHPVTGAEIVAVSAGRRMHKHTILDLAKQGFAFAR